MEGCVRTFVNRVCRYQNGKPHRANGPAIVWVNGVKWWYLNGKYLTEKEFNERRKEWKDT